MPVGLCPELFVERKTPLAEICGRYGTDAKKFYELFAREKPSLLVPIAYIPQKYVETGVK